MFKHVLIPTDGSRTAAKAIHAGVKLARKCDAVFLASHGYKGLSALVLPASCTRCS